MPVVAPGRPGALTGRQLIDGALHMVCAQPEFREQGSRVGGRPCRHSLLEAIHQPIGAGEIGTCLVDLADGDVRTQTRTTLVGLLAAQEQPQQRGLPCPVGTGDTDSLARVDLKRYRAKDELPCRTTAFSRVATTALDLGAAPIVNSSTHSFRGSTTSSRRAIRLSI